MQLKSTAPEGATADRLDREAPRALPLVKRNFIWMAVAAVMIVAGFLLMLGKSSTLQEFNPDIFSVRRTVVGPTLAFAGYVVMAVAILLRPVTPQDAHSDAAKEGADAA